VYKRGILVPKINDRIMFAGKAAEAEINTSRVLHDDATEKVEGDNQPSYSMP